MNAPPEGAELFDSEGVPVSRLAPDLAERFLTLVWTPDPKPASPQTASTAALEAGRSTAPTSIVCGAATAA